VRIRLQCRSGWVVPAISYFSPPDFQTHLSKLWDINQPSQVLQIRTLVVEPTKIEVLSGIPIPEGYEDIRRIGPFSSAIYNTRVSELTSVHSPQHGSDEFVNSETLLDEWDESRDFTFVIGRTSKTCKDEFLERFNLILECH